jgi:hypothetical protein
MQGDSYPFEVSVLVLIDSSVNIFGDSTRETFIFGMFEALLQIIFKNQNSMAQSFEKKIKENCCLF